MTITLQQAKRLSELGVRKEAYFCWMKSDDWDNYVVRTDLERQLTPEILSYVYPAYNAEELVSMIKGDLEIVRSEEMTFYTFCQMKDEDGIEYFGQVHGSTLTEALANKLIYDLENGIITAEDVNK